jgi:hypothetical protein
MSITAAPVRVLSTGHTGITVSDLDRSIRFYRDLRVIDCGTGDAVAGTHADLCAPIRALPSTPAANLYGLGTRP